MREGAGKTLSEPNRRPGVTIRFNAIPHFYKKSFPIRGHAQGDIGPI